MKMFQLFGKIPNHKRFNYTPRFYDPKEEERLERERRIRLEIMSEQDRLANEQALIEGDEGGHRKRMAGSFRMAKKTVTVQADPSANLLRLLIFTTLTVGLIGYLQYGQKALYVVMAIITPIYLFWKYRRMTKKN